MRAHRLRCLSFLPMLLALSSAGLSPQPVRLPRRARLHGNDFSAAGYDRAMVAVLVAGRPRDRLLDAGELMDGLC